MAELIDVANSSADPDTAVTKKASKPQKGRRSRLGIALRVLGVVFIGLLTLWIAAHKIPWVGSTLADGLRSVIGTEGVAKLEDFAYGLEDRWNQWWRADEKPKAYWEVPSEEPVAVTPPTITTTADAPSPDAPPPPPTFKPAKVGPVYDHMAAEGDGVWVPISDPVRPEAPAVMYKTLLHPDRKRPWAELFVVALDLRQLKIGFELGTLEPRATTSEGRKVERSGLIPEAERAALVGGFNGGFKLEHGRWGVGFGETHVVDPRTAGCTVARSKDGGMLIDRWPDIEEKKGKLSWWRQTPPCMFHDDERHGALWDPDAKGWGATLEGDTVIRRSAIGLSKDRETLYMGVGNHTAAHVLADGMHHAGAVDVAQLDVNWSYPRFVVFPREEGQRKTKSLFDGFEVDEEEYLRKPSVRDFFYVVRKPWPPAKG